MRIRVLFVAGLMVVALVVASGVAWAASISCPNRSGNLCVGTDNRDTMTGRDGRTDEMRARGGADEMRGRGGADEMQGQPGGDTVSGQDGPDALSGGPGADAVGGGKGKDDLSGGEGPDSLNGGGADDTYKFGINDWGNDTIADATTADSDPLTGNFAEFGFPDPLDTGVTVNLASSANSPEVSNGTQTGTVNWSNNAIDGVYVGTTTGAKITGNGLANQLNVSSEAKDTISGGAGNDWISAMDFSGGDSVDCGEDGAGVTDEDKVFVDPGDTQTNCERVNGQ
jgi:hypothetical protein